MATINRQIELLAPAGNVEKLKTAIHFGADAVYLGGRRFSLRDFADNFSLAEIREAVAYAHNHGVKVYVTCNVFPRNDELADIETYLDALGQIAPDAVIIADPGIVTLAGDVIPQVPIHLSTQANTTHIGSVLFWQRHNVSRINLARELSLMEIKAIAAQCDIETEAFVHGAMCISYSGRCLLSSFMTGRDSNRGMCSHPCRWKYAVVEAQRPGEYMPIVEDSRGTYLFNSKDLCMIEHLPAMIATGIDSLKIEGRMKGINYLASTVRVYRNAIDRYYEDPLHFQVDPEWRSELEQINHRGYCTGFYLGDPDQIRPENNGTRSISTHRFAGKVVAGDPHRVEIEVRNKIFTGDSITVVPRSGPILKDRISGIVDLNGQPQPYAQPGSRVCIDIESPCRPNDLIRRPTSDTDKQRKIV